jgi:hypothetical protein
VSRLLRSQKQRHFCQPQCAALGRDRSLTFQAAVGVAAGAAGSSLKKDFPGPLVSCRGRAMASVRGQMHNRFCFWVSSVFGGGPVVLFRS